MPPRWPRLPVEPGYDGYVDERPGHITDFFGTVASCDLRVRRRPSYAEQPPDSSGYWNDPTSRQRGQQVLVAIIYWQR